MDFRASRLLEGLVASSQAARGQAGEMPDLSCGEPSHPYHCMTNRDFFRKSVGSGAGHLLDRQDRLQKQIYLFRPLRVVDQLIEEFLEGLWIISVP